MHQLPFKANPLHGFATARLEAVVCKAVAAENCMGHAWIRPKRLSCNVTMKSRKVMQQSSGSHWGTSETAEPTVDKVFLGVIEHIGVLEAGKLALQAAQVALAAPGRLLPGRLQHLACATAVGVLQTFQRPAYDSGVSSEKKVMLRLSLGTWQLSTAAQCQHTCASRPHSPEHGCSPGQLA